MTKQIRPNCALSKSERNIPLTGRGSNRAKFALHMLNGSFRKSSLSLISKSKA